MIERLEESGFCEACVSAATDDDVIVDGYVEQAPSGDELIGHGAVIGARRGISARVVVRHHEHEGRPTEARSEG